MNRISVPIETEYINETHWSTQIFVNTCVEHSKCSPRAVKCVSAATDWEYLEECRTKQMQIQTPKTWYGLYYIIINYSPVCVFYQTMNSLTV